MTVKEARKLTPDDTVFTTTGKSVFIYRVQNTGLARVRFIQSGKLDDIPVERLSHAGSQV